MNELLRESLLWRMFVALAAWCRRTPPARWLATLRRLWCSGFLYSFFSRLLTAPSPVERSALYARRSALCARLSRSGYRALLEDSLLYRIYAAVMRTLRESVLVGWLFSGGLTTALLFLIAAYWPVDYLLRDVLQIPIVSSLWDEALILLGFLWALHRRASAKAPIASRLNSVGLMFGLYLLTGLVLLVFTSEALSVNITGLRASMQYILVFYLVLLLLRDETDLRWMYHVMVCIATVIALHGIYQFVASVPIPSHWTDQAESSVRTRVYSTFSNPNIMGAYMILFAPMAIGRAYEAESPAEKVLFWFCGLCMCLSCLFTMSRGAWLALAVAAVFFALLIDRRLFMIILCGAVAACFLPFVRSRISYLFTAEFAASNARGGRARRWATALEYVEKADAWVGGLGYGIYGGAVAVQNPINPTYDYMYVDNYYVKILTENGIAGLTALLSSLLGLLWGSFRAIARSERRKKPLCAGMLAGLLGLLVQSFFESIWEEPYMMALFFAIAGMLVWLGFFCPQKTGKE